MVRLYRRTNIYKRDNARPISNSPHSTPNKQITRPGTTNRNWQEITHKKKILDDVNSTPRPQPAPKHPPPNKTPGPTPPSPNNKIRPPVPLPPPPLGPKRGPQRHNSKANSKPSRTARSESQSAHRNATLPHLPKIKFLECYPPCHFTSLKQYNIVLSLNPHKTKIILTILREKTPKKPP